MAMVVHLHLVHPPIVSCYALLICTLTLLLPSGHGNPVLYHYTREQTTCPWRRWWDDTIPTPTPTDEVTWGVAPTPTGFMITDIPETKKTPYTIHDDWFVFAAAVCTLLTSPHQSPETSILCTRR